MSKWLFYDRATGALTGRTLQGPAEWVSRNTPTLAALKIEARAPLLRELQEADLAAIRPVAELLAGVDDGQAQTVLAQILERKAELRLELQAIDGAQDVAQLAGASDA